MLVESFIVYCFREYGFFSKKKRCPFASVFVNQTVQKNSEFNHNTCDRKMAFNRSCPLSLRYVSQEYISLNLRNFVTEALIKINVLTIS